jgi:hypothetical protein
MANDISGEITEEVIASVYRTMVRLRKTMVYLNKPKPVSAVAELWVRLGNTDGPSVWVSSINFSVLSFHSSNTEQNVLDLYYKLTIIEIYYLLASTTLNCLRDYDSLGF